MLIVKATCKEGSTLWPSLQAGSDSQAPILQLPHLDMDTIKRLSRKKVRGLGELLNMPEDDRLSVLQDIGQLYVELILVPQGLGVSTRETAAGQCFQYRDSNL